MAKKPKKIIITADDYAVIQARTCAGEVVDWFTELEIRDRMLRDYPGLREDSSEYEYRLWLECPNGEELKRDPVTNRLHIYRHDCWIEYRLAVHYCFEGQYFERIIECQWNRNGIPKDCKLDVCFYDNKPEELLWIREHHDPVMRSIIEELMRRLHTEENEVDNIW